MRYSLSPRWARSSSRCWSPSQPAQAATGIRVGNGRLVEGNGTALVLRGINHAHTWYPTQTSSFANIKAARRERGAGGAAAAAAGRRNTAADVANVIDLCKANRLICVLEDHDTTGFGEQSGAVTLDAAVELLDQRPRAR